MNVNNLKEKIMLQLKSLLDLKTQESLRALETLRESRNSETKSSAGDKFETGRAMVQMELEKIEGQLRNSLLLTNELSKIDASLECVTIKPGSLVFTNQENYFISIGIGKLEIEGKSYYAISLASPLGGFLKNKKKGEKASFQGREFLIESIH